MKLKLVLVSFLGLASAIQTYAQSPYPEKCGTMSHMEDLKIKDPSLVQRMIADEQLLQQTSGNSQVARTSNVVYTIPVVVHVVYRTAGQNISDAQIQSQIDVLNEDFGRRNADTISTPVDFRSVAAATQFQFCLARRDPSGNVTNGIERRLTTLTSFSQDDAVKSYTTGGLDAWDVNRYLNIWVCNMSGGILGYGEFPSSTHTNTYGVVVIFNSFGRIGLVSPPYNKGRTCTHEISHCFRLYHIWGDDGGSCSGSDYVADTPNQADATYGCFTFPHVDACATASPGIMYMNYMDYSDDNCLNMFTAGQSSRMFSSINAYYRTLFTSDGCLEVINGISDVPDFNFSVYPNPSEGTITIDMFTSPTISKNLKVRITDAVGRIVRDEKIENSAGYMHTVDLSGNENGLYFVTIYNDNYSKTTRVVLSK